MNADDRAQLPDFTLLPRSAADARPARTALPLQRSCCALAAAAGLILLGMLGCKTPKGPPDDPLFLNHAPIEVKPQAGPPIRLACTEPDMPPSPLEKKNAARPSQFAGAQPAEPEIVEIIPPRD